jgi:hypothetical protein
MQDVIRNGVVDGGRGTIDETKVATTRALTQYGGGMDTWSIKVRTELLMP